MLSRSRIKYIQSLARKKNRDAHQFFVAETPKVVNEFLNSSYKIKSLFADEDWLRQNEGAVGQDTERIIVSEDELRRISFLKNPHSVLAVLAIPQTQRESGLTGRIAIALDDLQDPGNLGTIIRIADWFGVEEVVCSHNTVDAYNPKVVQASMGSLAHVTVKYVDLPGFLSEATLPVYVADADGSPVYGQTFTEGGILVIGNEGKGVSEPVMQHAKRKISVPRIGRAESLNAAVATGILLSHFVGGKPR